ncbi:hypothetical protein NLI96_g9742 [Meripilus lineatus]|uniref:Uncharacterized protein n=1 Tax=Meripilus lineatus TaxID=2056292 RepID=A0AAD5UUX5_9APHY|nr:hypothetical protein NLI96_g9742 [Physisporinus lineatus]
MSWRLPLDSSRHAALVYSRQKVPFGPPKYNPPTRVDHDDFEGFDPFDQLYPITVLTHPFPQGVVSWEQTRDMWVELPHGYRVQDMGVTSMGRTFRPSSIAHRGRS